MLGKLLKYEFKSTARTFLPMYLVLFCFALLSRFSLAGMEDIRMSQNDFLNVLFVISLFGYVLVIFSVMIVTFMVIVQRFYKNMTGDEGYLMHTLPVSTHKLIQTKIISGVLWEIASIGMIVISLFVLLFQPWFVRDFAELMRELGEVMAGLTAEFGALRMLVLAVEIVLGIAVSTISSILMIYAAISIGHTFKTHRVLGGVAAYIGLSMLCQVISGFVMIFINIPAVNMDFPTPLAVADLIIATLGIGVIISTGFAIAWYFVTHYVLTSQLNLE